MKKSILFLISIFSVALIHAQPKNEQTVQETVTKLFDALSNKDSSALKDQCAPDVKFYEYGKAWPIDFLIKNAIAKNTSTDFKRTNKLDFINTTINGNTAWTTYDLYSTIISNGENISIHWMETVVLVKEKERWKIKLLHSTLVKNN